MIDVPVMLHFSQQAQDIIGRVVIDEDYAKALSDGAVLAAAYSQDNHGIEIHSLNLTLNTRVSCRSKEVPSTPIPPPVTQDQINELWKAVVITAGVVCLGFLAVFYRLLYG